MAKHYGVMDVNDICNIPVNSLAAENCALFLWAVWPNLFAAKDVIDSWGFVYKTVAWVWTKLNPSGVGFHYGLGRYSRANSEPCLIATRGVMYPVARDVQALIVSPVREHSRKPDEQYGKIERMYPGVPKVELFARRPWPGWDAYGNAIDGMDITEALS